MSHHPVEDIISKEHRAAIGLVATQWAALEHLMAQALCDLVANKSTAFKHDFAKLFPMIGMDARVLIGLLKTLVQVRRPSESKDFGKFADIVEAQKKVRDLLVHSVWTKGSAPDKIRTIQIKAVGSYREIRKELTVDEIKGTAIIIHELQDLLVIFMNSFGLLRQYRPRR